MRYLALLFVTIALLGCRSEQETEDQRKRINTKAEEHGCKLEYLGSFPMKHTSDIPVIVAICESKKTTSASYRVQEGKASVAKTVISIEDLNSQILELDKKRNALKKLSEEERVALGLK